MVFIIIKNDNILTVCDTIENVYHNILSYTRVILYCDKNKIDFMDSLKIVEYSNGYPTNSYKINTNTLDLYDENKNKISINNSTLSRSKVELEVLLKKEMESDVNLFIPFEVDSSEKGKWQKVLIDMLRECKWMKIYSNDKASLRFKPNTQGGTQCKFVHCMIAFS